jgi:threonine dehydratase
LIQSAILDERLRGDLLLKPECWQRTGSFKIRGAYNRLCLLPEGTAARGAVAWSSGNHAQGVAAAGRLLGIHTTIVMPKDAPRSKLDNTRRLGGEVVTYDRYTGNREKIARAIAAERGAALVPSFEHPDVIAGQGTVGLEIARQSTDLGLKPDQVVIPCGGGGLTAGCAIALRSRWPDIEVIVAEPEFYDDTTQSLQGHERISVPTNVPSLCDALLTDAPGNLTLEIMRRHGTRGVVVSEAEVKAAMRVAFKELKLVLEPGGAAALAAVLSGRVVTENRVTAVVLSGGNVDVDVFSAIQLEPV